MGSDKQALGRVSSRTHAKGVAKKRVRKIAASSRNVAVSLVSMPFKELRHPPIQLGILERCLKRAGISARSHSLEIAFMEHLHTSTVGTAEGEEISIAQYQDVAHRDFVVHLGEWIFKVPPYADPAREDEEYLDYVRDFGIPEHAITSAIRMKALVPAFLESAANELLADSPRVVGFSTVFQQNVPSLVLAKILKEKDPSLTIVFGGDNCDGPMGAALHESFPWIDVVVRGEGERVLVEVVTDVLADRPIRPQPGLCYRVQGEAVVVSSDSKPQLPISEVPSPTYDDFFERLARSPLRAELSQDVAILFESSRGCWWGAKQHCTFCGLNAATMMFRSKPAAQVAEEIMELAARYKVLKFVAVDDIIDLAHVRDLLPMLKESGCDLQIFYETKANLTKEQVKAFQNAGVTDIQPGIESLSSPILRLMRKGVTALQNLRLLKWCAESGVAVAWNLLSGFPGEPPDEYKRMAELVPSLVHLEAPTFSDVQVQRFSPYFERAEEFGLELMGPMPYYRFLYPIAPDKLANLAYDFEHRYHDGRDPKSYTQVLREAVGRWREASERGFGSLRYRRGPGFLIVEDRRPSLESFDYQFDGPEAKIYLACDAGATPTEVAAHLAAAGEDNLDAEEIKEFLDELVEARLMYCEDNRYLALAIAPSAVAVSSQTQRAVNVAAA
jgi:ribosomal peptide maturation radical SAM protein 1